MSISDPVADFLTRVRNGLKAQHKFVDVSWSKMKESIASILMKEGLIQNFVVKKDTESRGTIRIFLKYSSGRRPVISGLKKVSKPGLRKYVSHQDIPSFYGGLGLPIISTSKGVMSGQEAKKNQVGGELICLVW